VVNIPLKGKERVINIVPYYAPLKGEKDTL